MNIEAKLKIRLVKFLQLKQPNITQLDVSHISRCLVTSDQKRSIQSILAVICHLSVSRMSQLSICLPSLCRFGLHDWLSPDHYICDYERTPSILIWPAAD
jgi:hypothetical protein